MTRNESFKKRIRARMAKTGEKYGAARRTLLEQAASSPADWVSEPETSEEAVREATGRGWEEWRSILDDWDGDRSDHTAMVSHVHEHHGVDSWWSQSVVVGYERITGLRLPHQMADGTFTANKSATVDVDATVLREMLLDADGRQALFGGMHVALRSRPSTKVLRFGVGPGVALIAVDPAGGGRSKVTISHGKLPEAADVRHWKAFWTEWLAALSDSA